MVEGTALASLPHMAGVLARRPAQFPSLDAAVHWALDSGMSRSTAAAHVSFPAMLCPAAAAPPPAVPRGDGSAVPAEEGGLGPIAEEGEEEGAGQQQQQQRVADRHGTTPSATAPAAPGMPRSANGSSGPSASCGPSGSSGPSGPSGPSGTAASASAGDGGPWVWRTPLLASEPAWEGWYQGLSEAFLALPVPKVRAIVSSSYGSVPSLPLLVLLLPLPWGGWFKGLSEALLALPGGPRRLLPRQLPRLK